MSTIGEMWVNIGADISDFERDTQRMQDQLKGMGKDMETAATGLGVGANRMGDSWRNMSEEMKLASQQSKAKLEPFKKQMQELQYEFHQMAQGMNDYKGSNQDFMNELEKMGQRHKKITDEMMKNNDMLKRGFIQGVATMLARSTSSEKIAANYDRINNPLYKINNGFLAITHNMEKMAAQGAPAALALSMLGPTANMKALNDQIMLINQGLMRHQMVVIAAALASVVLYGGLHKAAMNTIPEYSKAWTTMTSRLKEAFKPMVEVFAAVMGAVWRFITVIAELMIKFNEAHPILAKMIQGFVMLLPALFLLLAPLAVGIGLFNGMKAVFYATWMMIKPLIVGLAAMSGTVLIVAAAIVLVSAALWALWTKTDWFKGAVLGAWEQIKKGTKAAWDWIYLNGIKPAIDNVMLYVGKILAEMKLFWAEHGETIKQIVSIAFTYIKGVFQVQLAVLVTAVKVAFILIKTAITTAWNAIKMVISIAFSVIKGLFDFWLNILKGDFKGAWEAYIGIFKDSFGAILNFFENQKRNFFNAGKGLMEQVTKGIKDAAASVMKTVEDIAGKIRDFLPFSPAKTGPLSDLDKLDFGGPMADSLKNAIPTVRSLMSDLVTLPNINANNSLATAGGGGESYGDIHVSINAGDLEEMQTIFDFFSTIKQAKRARG